MRLPWGEITRRIQEGISRHTSQDPVHARQVAVLESLKLKVYTDATRPSAATLGAGTVIYNADDDGLNVSDGADWRAPSGGWVVT